MRKIINMLKKNDNAYSVGRICAVIGFVVWVLVEKVKTKLQKFIKKFK